MFEWSLQCALVGVSLELFMFKWSLVFALMGVSLCSKDVRDP